MKSRSSYNVWVETEHGSHIVFPWLPKILAEEYALVRNKIEDARCENLKTFNPYMDFFFVKKANKKEKKNEEN
jgi:hypothetical protein